MTVELAVVFLLVLANGAFSMSEMAVVSARKARLEHRARGGDRRARAALDLATDPADFLSTIQVGITLIGILAGAYGGATLAGPLAARLSQVPALAGSAELLAMAIVVASITVLSLVLGELVPKRVALAHPEAIAAAVARPMKTAARLAGPLVRLLSGASTAVLALLRVRPSADPEVTEEEIRLLIAKGVQAGMFEEAERAMLERVFRFADRRVHQLMTPRRKIIWLDVDDGAEAVAAKIAGQPFSRYPVARGSLDDCLGFVRTRDLLDMALQHRTFDLSRVLRQPLIVPENTRAMAVLERFRDERAHFALVVDEYGGVEGLVTLNDLLDAILGDMPGIGEAGEPPVVRRADGSWLVDGTLPAADLKELLACPKLPGEERGAYRTLGGLVMHQLGKVPATGDRFEWGGFRFEVVDMDGHLVDKVLIARHDGAEQTEEG